MNIAILVKMKCRRFKRNVKDLKQSSYFLGNILSLIAKNLCDNRVMEMGLRVYLYQFLLVYKVVFFPKLCYYMVFINDENRNEL